ncbi:hypothetical protein [Nitrincola iocasae]|uniref:Uncharacterized protein n=1 Tax=Nitrincola iocasae TaxID=2614693 RepID=A0A5J6LC71_9GAMM|nr:hypothetical protein [Nitrincola iocasae]QEW05888.1 hypothetical protein F5I99_04960 [Nitrincola iocasae]
MTDKSEIPSIVTDDSVPREIKPDEEKGDSIKTDAIAINSTSASVLPPTELFDYIANLYQGQNFNKAYKNAFNKIDLESRLTPDQHEQLLQLSKNGDKDNKLLISLAEFLLEGLGGVSLRDTVMKHIEYVISDEGDLSKVQTKYVFQAWMDKCDIANRVSFMMDQIDNINDGIDKNGKPKPLTDSRKNIIKCIASIWLFYRGYADLKQIFRELSKETFGVDTVASESVERRALGFAAKMAISNSRDGFAFFINYFSRQQSMLANDLSHSRSHVETLRLKVQALTEEISQLKVEADTTKNQVQDLSSKIVSLEDELTLSKEKASHQGIHQRDELDTLKGNISSFLEQELAPLLRSALAANSRTPPKTRVVDIKLDDTLQQVEGKIQWLRQ